MGIQLNSLKELATISMTAVEFDAVDNIICSQIGNPSFQQDYNSLMFDITNTYQVVVDNLKSLSQIASEQDFSERYTALSQVFLDSYLKEISQPRVNAEFTYEKYLQFRKLKEVKTGFPLLKLSFARLHDLIDKWIDNDIWLAMTIDSLFKMTARQLNELNELKKRDVEDAFILYQSSIYAYQPYLEIIMTRMRQIASRHD